MVHLQLLGKPDSPLNLAIGFCFFRAKMFSHVSLLHLLNLEIAPHIHFCAAVSRPALSYNSALT